MSTSSSGNSNKDNVFDLDSTAFASDHFRMHEFKVKRCPRARPHDWTQCPFAHPGEKARRRDPRRYRYSGTACPEFRKSGCCRRGDACPFAHGVFECWLHPSRYRTQLCTDGQSCKRRVCFFAHCEPELRRPEDDPVTAERQVQAELAAEVQVLQQQHLAQALQTILDASNITNTGGASAPASASSPLFALELLKQVTMPSGTMMGPSDTTDSSNGSNNALNLLQQLGMLQQQQPATGQQQAQQQLQETTKEEDSSTSKPMQQSLLSGTNQEDLQQALKQVLEQQLAKPAVNSPVSAPSTTPEELVATSQPENLAINSMPFLAGAGGLDTSQLLQLDPAILNGLLGGQNNVARPRAPPTTNRHSIDNSFLASKLLGMSTQIPVDQGSGQGTMLPIQVSRGQVGNGHATGRSLEMFVDPMMMGQVPVTASQPHPVANGMPMDHGQPDASQVLPMGGQQFVNGVNSAVSGVPLDQNPALSAQLLQLDPALLNSLAARARHAGTVGASPQRMVDNGFLARMSNVDVSGIVNGVVAQPETAASQMVVPGVPVPLPDVNAGFAQNGALMAQAQALLQCLNMDGMKMMDPTSQQQQAHQQAPQPAQPGQFHMMGGYDKGLHQHERVNSGGNEAATLMNSNMLQ
ncbi:hypothetical protein BSKO_09335 [Bryopsis sp. KO-2023]|nr:hypothetical protein BSKO_09335 [Bryopsis sp. KO-2023]